MMNTNTKVTGVYYTYKGDEETMKGLVAEHGAVVTRCIPAKCRFRQNNPFPAWGQVGRCRTMREEFLEDAQAIKPIMLSLLWDTELTLPQVMINYGVGSFMFHLHRSRLLENQELLGQLLGGAG